MFTVNVVITAVLLVISISAYCLRVWIRVIKAKQHKSMEYTLLWALLLQIVSTGLQVRVYSLLQTLEQNPMNVVEIGKMFFVGAILHFGALWSVKISISLLHIELTRMLPRVHFWAICTFWLMVITLPVIYIVLVLGCLPVPKRWAPPTGPGCRPIVKSFDFWVHNAIHLSTDIILCVLPFPALAKVSERRLRIAVYMVYSLGLVSIAVTIARIVLLATDASHSIEKIMLLSQAEITTCIVIGVLPGASSAFTRKYIYGISSSSAQVARRSSAGRTNSKHPHDPPKPNPADFIELHSRVPKATYFRDRDDSGSLAGSTVEIIQTPAKSDRGKTEQLHTMR
ncbi:hypothetical protein EDB81DRAFT_33686 [Dactylonectria macrodidyma]|uniref:Rhodopsin domain-containing protein n=1 Tax=Dactylonectria macrodidyma TaxID=307937 RepID=A0A9P9FS21_9HYPO|nr:hypothetical protein EDB81DRAFT_33686 [Dactylonectria macrodidyma]